MELPTHGTEQLSDFRIKSTQGVAITTLILLTPFSIHNFAEGRIVLGVGSLAIVAILAFKAWSIGRGRYYPGLTFFALVPIILALLAAVFYEHGIVGALWSYPAVISFYFILSEKKAWIANLLLLALMLPIAWMVLDHALAARVAATLLVVSTFSIIFMRVITSQQEKLQMLAVTDPLTGVFNRTLLRTTLEQAVLQSRRTQTPMTLIALDLDHFKQINDDFGHDGGDTVLRGVGKLLSHRLRRVDRVFRLGGEEFLALLYGTDEQNGRRVAKELCDAVSTHSFLDEHRVTVSIGVATLQPDENWRAWTKRADENLYHAKSKGRNQVSIGRQAVDEPLAATT